METITIQVSKDDVYEEVAKATDYTGAKLINGDENARDRILATDSDLSDLSRFWEESVLATNERLKEMVVSGETKSVDVDKSTKIVYEVTLEVSKSFDRSLTANVQSAIRNFFIASIIGQWFKFSNKGEAKDYFSQAGEMMNGAERLLYSRKKPTRPMD